MVYKWYFSCQLGGFYGTYIPPIFWEPGNNRWNQKGDLPLWEGNAFQSLFRNVQVQLRAKEGEHGGVARVTRFFVVTKKTHETHVC